MSSNDNLIKEGGANAASPVFPTQVSAAIAPVARALPYVTLAVVFLWFGGMKFTAYEAGAIEGLIANSPILSFLLSLFSAQGASNLIGVVELVIAGLLAARIIDPRLSVAGAVGAVVTFALTLTFFFSTPGVFLEDVGGPAISVLPGQFLLKDLALLALSFWVLSDSLASVSRQA